MYANVNFGPNGAQFDVTTTKRRPLGTALILQDGRTFRYAENGGVALAAGRVAQSEVPTANWDELAIPTAVTAGTRTFNVTNGATTILADDFADGYMNVEDDAGEGHLYQIQANDAEAAGSAAFSLTLMAGEGVIVAFSTATTVGLTKHWLKDVIIHPSPATATIAGVAPVLMPIDNFGWIQVHGPSSVLHDSTTTTITIARTVVDSADVDGAVCGFVASGGALNNKQVIGQAMEVSATAEESLVFLRLE